MAVPFSYTDTTTIGFDPYADLRKYATNNINVSATAPGVTLTTILPYVFVAVVALLIWKMLRK